MAAMDTMDPPQTARLAGAERPFLVVLCHGFGATGAQLSALAAAGARMFPQAVFLLPDGPQACPRTLRSLLNRTTRRQWFPLGTTPRLVQMAAARQAALGLSQRVNAELARRELPPDAVWFVGFSQGAMVSLLAGLTRKVAPRGIIGIAGALLAPEDFVPDCKPPVLLVHGTGDSVVPAKRSEEAAHRLRAAGLAVRLELLTGLGHGIVADAAPLAGSFILEHLR